MSKTCVATCDDGYFADSSTRLCVQVCPQIPSYFGRIDNKRCVAECPGGTFADNDTRQCVTDCTTSPI